MKDGYNLDYFPHILPLFLSLSIFEFSPLVCTLVFFLLRSEGFFYRAGPVLIVRLLATLLADPTLH